MMIARDRSWNPLANGENPLRINGLSPFKVIGYRRGDSLRLRPPNLTELYVAGRLNRTGSSRPLSFKVRSLRLDYFRVLHSRGFALWMQNSWMESRSDPYVSLPALGTHKKRNNLFTWGFAKSSLKLELQSLLYFSLAVIDEKNNQSTHSARERHEI